MAETSLLTLDVGCGIYPKGDVNTDLIRREQKIPNFVVADAHNLPFKDGSFGLVYSSHVIEHVTNPTIMFNELCRVTKAKMIVRCPHRFGSGAKRVSHINFIDEAPALISTYTLLLLASKPEDLVLSP